MIEIIILAVILSLDILTVAFTQGLVFTNNKVINSLKLSFAVGIFHFVMLILGGFCGLGISRFAHSISHLVIFLIFLFLGVKFIIDALKDKDENFCIGNICFTNIILIAFATSIDALGVGVSVYFTSVGIVKSALIIGFTAALFSNLGFLLGNFFKKLPSKALEIFAGLVLILFGIKALIEYWI